MDLLSRVRDRLQHAGERLLKSPSSSKPAPVTECTASSLEGQRIDLAERLHRLDQAAHRIEYLLTKVATGEHPRRNRGMDRAVQLLMQMKYRELAAQGRSLPTFDEVEMRFFSQHGADGILWYLFSLLGATNKRCIEICAGDGIECNSANLIVNHGWSGLLVDGGEDIIRKGDSFYKDCGDTWYWPPRTIQAWVTTESVNSLVTQAGFSGPIDLLSLDMDGMDYWVWKALECVTPRVVVLEYNPALGPSVSRSLPYNPKFSMHEKRHTPGHRWYFGASLQAYVNLARRKGYRLVGVERYCFNAYFVQNGLGEKLFPEVDPSTCFNHPSVPGVIAELKTIQDSMEWVDV